jgi:hypothetical protein
MSVELQSEHDGFHAPGSDLWWFEAFWFSFFIPERQLMVYIYPWFRANMGLAGGGVVAWDAGAYEPWNIVHNDYAWHLSLGDPTTHVSGATLALPQGIIIDTLEPDTRYRVRYDHELLSIDIVFTASQPANVVTRALGASQLFAGRIDQCGKVEGHIILRGERLAVNCYSMRDRSWGVRQPNNVGMHVGYFHATFSAGEAFLVVSDAARAKGDAAPIVNGYLLRDGTWAALAEGSARLGRDADGRPLRCTIDATDELGRTMHAVGTSSTWFAYQPYPGMFNWSCLADWSADGRSGIGELQDTWYPDDWRRFHEGLRRGPVPA